MVTGWNNRIVQPRNGDTGRLIHEL